MDDPQAKPPVKIRVTKLQEAQLPELVRIDHEIVEMYAEAGIAGPSPRSDVALAAMTRNHDILVAEADDHVSGFLVWADQAPGVAWVAELAIDPMRHRQGLATRMLRELGETAQGHGIELVVASCYDTAPWALSFLAVRGFQKVEPGAGMPTKLAAWLELRQEPVGDGQSLWWSETDGLGTVPGLPRPDSVRFT